MTFIYKVGFFKLVCCCSGCIGCCNEFVHCFCYVCAGTDLLKHIPPCGTSFCPSANYLIVVAHVWDKCGVLRHQVISFLDIAKVFYRPVTGSFYAFRCLSLIICHEVDKCLSCFDLSFVSIIKDTESPDTATELWVTIF